jgi:site-specific DNA-methyltransferase (adenine-specific)
MAAGVYGRGMQNEITAPAKTVRANHIVLGGDAGTRPCEHRGNAWETPAAIVDDVRDAFGGRIDLDPATEPHNPVGAARFYTAAEDGLMQAWGPVNVYLNPPYSKVEPWIAKAIAESAAGARIYMLLPVRTDAAYHQRLLHDATDVLFVRGRLAFVHADLRGRPKPAAFCSMFVGLNISTKPLLHLGVRMWHSSKQPE